VTATVGLEPLLEYLKTQRGFDFTGYKRSSLERRITKRMEELGIESYEAYLDHLELNQDEFAFLFNTILINVTGFFRDPESWDYLAQQVVPTLLEATPDGPIRVWCAGCSSGEETYTVAMVLAEALGETAYLARVKIYATDVDDEALDTGRAAIYSPKQVEAVPPELLQRYFERGDARYTFRTDLRRTVIFGRNDLVQDAPISRIDLLVCRNTLMYFNAETQAQILNRFHFALKPAGYLFMGKSEMLITHTDLFAPANLTRRVFRKVDSGDRARPRSAQEAPVTLEVTPARPERELEQALLGGTFEASPLAELIVARDGTVELANRAARNLLGLSADDLGRPLKDFEASYRPVELRSHLDRMWKTRRPVEVSDIEFTPDDGRRRALELRVSPLLDGGHQLLGAAVVFTDVTGRAELTERLELAKRELESSYEELQSTVEELETTNEELQSTNEELETTNEELQSTNEELETMNEELQSTNEELETINEELRERSGQLDEANAFLETILTSQGLAVVVVDRSLRVQIWNQQSTELWGLRADEVRGEHLLGLDVGLPLEALKTSIRATLDGSDGRSTMTVEATNRRGRTVRCEVTLLGLRAASGDVTGAILLMKATPAG
jgi:two-component system, chemotaxis family, CheB/CheR fusion protein